MPSRLLVGASLFAAALATRCTTFTTLQPLDPIEEIEEAPVTETSEFIPVVCYGRYTLVELAPTIAQRDQSLADHL